MQVLQAGHGGWRRGDGQGVPRRCQVAAPQRRTGQNHPIGRQRHRGERSRPSGAVKPAAGLAVPDEAIRLHFRAVPQKGGPGLGAEHENGPAADMGGVGNPRQCLGVTLHP